MAAVTLKNKGFGLAEFLAAAGLTAMAAAFLVPAYGGVQKYLLKMEAERAAQCLAGDIAALQQYSFYDISGKSRLEMDGGKLAVLRKFENGLYFDQHFNALKFSGEGAPSAANNYIIKCRQDKTISKWLQVQPVTGRVVFK